jgi:hypothetical protein
VPAKSDFEGLVEWCTQPGPSAFLRRSVGAHLLVSFADRPGGHWEGNLSYAPANGSRRLPEGFRGVVRPGNLNLSFTVGEDFALVGLGTYEECEVEQITDQGPGFLEAIWTPGEGGTYYCWLWHSYSYTGPSRV